jgi:hypothetical protein
MAPRGSRTHKARRGAGFCLHSPALRRRRASSAAPPRRPPSARATRGLPRAAAASPRRGAATARSHPSRARARPALAPAARVPPPAPPRGPQRRYSAVGAHALSAARWKTQLAPRRAPPAAPKAIAPTDQLVGQRTAAIAGTSFHGKYRGREAGHTFTVDCTCVARARAEQWLRVLASLLAVRKPPSASAAHAPAAHVVRQPASHHRAHQSDSQRVSS